MFRVKFLKGIIFGGLLVTATAIGFAMSKEGRQFAEKLKENIEPMEKNLKKNFGKLHEVAKDDFEELVNAMVDEYSKKNKISDDSKETLASALKSKWEDIKEKF